jgi:putative redox protein
MQSRKVHFTNHHGRQLAGRIDLPLTGEPLAYALYAHCFTCNKNLRAIGRISETLAHHGIATLRFDFTGLGESEGDFSESNFSSSVKDYLMAADFLSNEFEAPELLIGHSLGGAVTLAAAPSIGSARAVITLAAPVTPAHIQRHIAADLATIESEGHAEVDLAGRQFTLRQQLIDDIESVELDVAIKNLRRPLLVVHSPIDNVVGVENASEILDHARHPKSFLSLDGADHMITRDEDARYVAEVIAVWANRYSSGDLTVHSQPDFVEDAPESVTVVRIEDGFRTEVISNGFPLVADEPESVGGTNTGPTPYDYLLTALGACTAMTLRMYADRKGWPLDVVTVNLTHRKVHAEDCAECEAEEGYADHIDREILVEGALGSEQRQRLAEIADRCPIHKTLHGEVVINSSLATVGSSARSETQNEVN